MRDRKRKRNKKQRRRKEERRKGHKEVEDTQDAAFSFVEEGGHGREKGVHGRDQVQHTLWQGRFQFFPAKDQGQQNSFNMPRRKKY